MHLIAGKNRVGIVDIAIERRNERESDDRLDIAYAFRLLPSGIGIITEDVTHRRCCLDEDQFDGRSLGDIEFDVDIVRDQLPLREILDMLAAPEAEHAFYIVILLSGQVGRVEQVIGTPVLTPVAEHLVAVGIGRAGRGGDQCARQRVAGPGAHLLLIVCNSSVFTHGQLHRTDRTGIVRIEVHLRQVGRQSDGTRKASFFVRRSAIQRLFGSLDQTAVHLSQRILAIDFEQHLVIAEAIVDCNRIFTRGGITEVFRGRFTAIRRILAFLRILHTGGRQHSAANHQEQPRQNGVDPVYINLFHHPDSIKFGKRPIRSVFRLRFPNA